MNTSKYQVANILSSWSQPCLLLTPLQNVNNHSRVQFGNSSFTQKVQSKDPQPDGVAAPKFGGDFPFLRVLAYKLAHPRQIPNSIKHQQIVWQYLAHLSPSAVRRTTMRSPPWALGAPRRSQNVEHHQFAGACWGGGGGPGPSLGPPPPCPPGYRK